MLDVASAHEKLKTTKYASPNVLPEQNHSMLAVLVSLMFSWVPYKVSCGFVRWEAPVEKTRLPMTLYSITYIYKACM